MKDYRHVGGRSLQEVGVRYVALQREIRYREVAGGGRPVGHKAVAASGERQERHLVRLEELEFWEEVSNGVGVLCSLVVHWHRPPEVPCQLPFQSLFPPHVYGQVHDVGVSDGPAQGSGDDIVGREVGQVGALQLFLLDKDGVTRQHRDIALPPGPTNLLCQPAHNPPLQHPIPVFLRQGGRKKVEGLFRRAVPSELFRGLPPQKTIQLADKAIQGFGISHNVRQVDRHAHSLFQNHQLHQEDLASMAQSEAAIHGRAQ
mmetsp:Transcript_9851/g.23677  ORF Transcript_9851/g.23677 Transcript_9851/m.23677 type:complete len:259 (+) Transcript_9851:63-839(+)